MEKFLVATFYKFVNIAHLRDVKDPLFEQCCRNGVRGTILLAHEGVNGTISGPQAGVGRVLSWLNNNKIIGSVQHQESWANEIPFHRMKVRLKREIVAMGVPGLNPENSAGIYIEPADWNALLADPSVAVIDTRNDYEVAIGTFKGAINPATHSFREFVGWTNRQARKLEGKKIAMFCTGGIRCEKSTTFMKKQGYETVFHLKGGILRYLAEIKPQDSQWQGECFVFDQRVSLGYGLERGNYDLCYACRQPIREADKQSAHFVIGVSCPNCYNQISLDRRHRFEERQRQIELSAIRNSP